MGKLQLGLLILGGLLLLAMLIYYLRLSSKSQARQMQSLSSTSADLSFEREPTLDLMALDKLIDEVKSPAAVLENMPHLDALLDAIVTISLEAEVSGDALLAALPSSRRVGSKTFMLEGFHHASQSWESPHPGRRYKQLQAGLQLVNRVGAVNEIEFSEFVVKIEALCQALNASADFPDMRHEIQRARELDQFASTCDVQIAFVLRPRQAAWSAGYIQQMAAALGFVVGTIPGRMVLPGAGTALLNLNFDAQAALAEDISQSILRQLTLSLDVSQVPRAESAFARMCEQAQALAQKIDAVLSDDNGVELSHQAMADIGVELDRLYNTLEQHGFGAGSVLARRLFS